MFFFRIRPACRSGAGGVEPGGDQRVTDRRDAGCSRAVCLGVDWSVWDAGIARATG